MFCKEHLKLKLNLSVYSRFKQILDRIMFKFKCGLVNIAVIDILIDILIVIIS